MKDVPSITDLFEKFQNPVEVADPSSPHANKLVNQIDVSDIPSFLDLDNIEENFRIFLTECAPYLHCTFWSDTDEECLNFDPQTFSINFDEDIEYTMVETLINYAVAQEILRFGAQPENIDIRVIPCNLEDIYPNGKYDGRLDNPKP